MLFNPSWSRKPDVDEETGIHTMSSLISWLETKDPKEEYTYARPYECLLAQYYIEQGLKNVKVTPHELSYGRGKQMELPQGFNDIAIYSTTFGGALKSARTRVHA